MTQAERIERMSRALEEACRAADALEAALARWRALQPAVDELEAYYTSGSWLRDYEDDEAGRLPASLCKGALSEDGIDTLLGRRDALRAQIPAEESEEEPRA